MPEFTRHQKAILFALVALGLIGAGLGLRKSARLPRSGEVVQIVDNSDEARGTKVEKPIGNMLVHIAGKVRKAGVYRLPPDSRVIHAIRAAGGCLPNADTDALNLAAKLNDGEQIYVPSKEQTRAASTANTGRPASVNPLAGKPLGATRRVNLPAVRIGGHSSTGKLSVPGEGTVNINTADEQEFQRLPGVGPVTAQKILEYRQQIGRFADADQIMNVKGIGPKKFEKMRPFVTL